MNWRPVSRSNLDQRLTSLAERLLPHDKTLQSSIASDHLWQHVFFLECAAESQFDVLIDLARQGLDLPHGILCIAGSGKNFHGFKNRPWMSANGNIHLSAFVAPKQHVPHFAVGFTILSAVSVLQALDTLEGLEKQAMVKWVNDIIIGNAKVGGVLTSTQTQGKKVTGAVLGIGLNVEAAPQIEPTPFVPEVVALRDLIPRTATCDRSIVFHRLIHFLDRNYRSLIAGDFHQLLEFYRKRSAVIGRIVRVFTDTPDENSEEIISGRVQSIGENLELFFDGVPSPVWKGRAVLLPSVP